MSGDGMDMNNLIKGIIDKMPAGVIVFDKRLQVIMSNKWAAIFMKRYTLPDEITALGRKIFDAIKTSRLGELFPGEVYLYKKIEGSPSKWTFKFDVCECPEPFLSVFITEESLSNKIDLLKVRRHFKLTRRETDVLRRVISGFKNTDIAEDLEITEQTVKDHLSNIYMKLGVENRFALAQFLLNFPES
jgi:DNA-binding CsgD family transcriptional regulator